ncbi:MAG: hypothetical protein KA100_03750 [Rickettsiales bacterium]|nr:hypothetical protein [Rickettsiales bacterium]
MLKKHQPTKSKTPHDHEALPRKKKKKIPLFYKLNFSILLIASLLLAYFLVLVSIEPKSIPLVTKKIEEVLQDKLQTDVSLAESYVSFTRYGTLKVVATGLKILYVLPGATEKQPFVIPKLETEFSLLRMLFLRFEPSKIKVVNPTIVVEDLQKFRQASQENASAENPVIQFLSAIRSGEFPIENFEIENALILAKGQNFDTQILLKKSQIRTSIEGGALFVSSENKLSFDEEKSDVDLKSSCRLSKSDGLKCDVVLENFVVNSVADLHPNLIILNNLNTSLKASASFVVKEKKLGEVLFKVEAKKGDFFFPEFFAQKMDFSDFLVSGKYDNNSGFLNFAEIKTFLTSASGAAAASNLQMSLVISDVRDLQNQKLDFDIKLQNAPINELEKLWPVALNQSGIRTWVIAHVKGGKVKDAYAKFSLQKNAAEFLLNDIDAELKIAGTNLNYDPTFPEIKNIDATAKFNKQSMKIVLTSGEVLNSKISEGLVEIDDFLAAKTMLKISGKSQGHAADSLKHVDHKSSDFVSLVEKYLNGNSQNDFDIRLPLVEKVDLKDVYVAINSNVSDLKNDYLKGALEIRCKKDFASNDFVTKVNLTAAELNVQPFDVTKKAGVESILSLAVSVKNPKKIKIKNIELTKKEAKNLAKISGEVEFETAPFLLAAVDLKNNNFGKNNYVFSYVANKKTSTQKISLKAQNLNFAPFIEQKFFAGSSGGEKFSNINVQLAVNDLALLHNKSLKNFYLFLSCNSDFCSNGLAKASQGNKQLIDLRAAKNAQENFVEISGRINDVGYVAEAFGISTTISGGVAEVKLQSKMLNKNQAFEGLVTIDDEITFYETARVKRLASNDLFSKIKDKIFSNEKTTFNSVKIDLALQDGVLDLKSLIANNYKIGITAKGLIDLNNDTYAIKGMIVPGFIVNNLFGIGKIPVLGSVVGLLTGGEGGGLFGIRYEYTKKKDDKEATFETNKVSSFVPTSIKSLFDLI